jgi:hypothetical protein
VVPGESDTGANPRTGRRAVVGFNWDDMHMFSFSFSLSSQIAGIQIGSMRNAGRLMQLAQLLRHPSDLAILAWLTGPMTNQPEVDVLVYLAATTPLPASWMPSPCGCGTRPTSAGLPFPSKLWHVSLFLLRGAGSIDCRSTSCWVPLGTRTFSGTSRRGCLVNIHGH